MLALSTSDVTFKSNFRFRKESIEKQIAGKDEFQQNKQEVECLSSNKCAFFYGSVVQLKLYDQLEIDLM